MAEVPHAESIGLTVRKRFDRREGAFDLGPSGPSQATSLPYRSSTEHMRLHSYLLKIFILALLAFALCSCADSYDILGLHLKPAANGDYDNAGHVPGSGDPE
jgi:hypothetical protein